MHHRALTVTDTHSASIESGGEVQDLKGFKTSPFVRGFFFRSLYSFAKDPESGQICK